MLLYENALSNKYNEIKALYPVWYQDVLEMDVLWKAWGQQLGGIQAGIIQAVDNNFIDFADVQAISKFETFLGIQYDGPRTLSERRNVVKAFINGNGHIGQKEIKESISAFTNGTITVELIGGAIQVTVTRDFSDRFNLYDVHLVLDKRIPAHLVLSLVDKLLPVFVKNEESFIFQGINISSGVKERTANLVAGWILNGENLLDGSWLLDSAYPGLPFINFSVKSAFNNSLNLMTSQLGMAIYRFQNDFHIENAMQYPITAQNQEDFIQNSIRFTGCKASQPYSLTGSVKIDGWWTLNGDYILNGSMKLNQIYIEEDL